VASGEDVVPCGSSTGGAAVGSILNAYRDFALVVEVVEARLMKRVREFVVCPGSLAGCVNGSRSKKASGEALRW
jgi:hypothetical protein